MTHRTIAEPLFAAFLQHQGYVLFEAIGDGNYRWLGMPPAFSDELFGAEPPGGEPTQLEGRLPFLDAFLIQAEAFWESNTEGQLDSGAWVEAGADGHEIPLEASALRLVGRRVLCIRHLQARYDEHVELLQRGRDGLLAHDRLLREVLKKEILLHTIVHDLSQPLTAMRGCFSMMSAEPIPDELQELVDIGRRQAEKQESMIREILQAFSSEVAAQHAIHSDPGQAPDVAQCAKAVARDYGAAFAEHGSRIVVDPPPDESVDWRVVGDDSRLTRVFSNLVENALRHAPSGSTVTLRLEDEGPVVRACVDDQGPGLPRGENAPKLFALFSKGKERGGKAGLGLYFCRITVERWGGTIGAESRVEGGARFWFRLPRAGARIGDAGHAGSEGASS
jgi:signal transduction histidine kinase